MSKHLPKIIHATFPAELGAGVLLLTEPPYIMGKIILFDSHIGMISQLNSGKFVAYYAIPGYQIAVVYWGVFGKGYKISGEQNSIKQANQVLQELGLWYLTERIEKSPGRYKRYSLDNPQN